MAVCVTNITYFDDFLSQSANAEKDNINAFRQLYDVKETLGSGSFGTVVRAVDRILYEEVAIKIIPKDSLVTAKQEQFLYRELKALSELKHPGIIEFRDALQDDENVYIVTEFCPGGTLEDCVYALYGGLTEREALVLMHQVLEAVEYSHSNNIAHRDIKLENIMFVGDELKLIDFGLCFEAIPGGGTSSMEYVGTPLYAAPEVVANTPYVPTKADMWSCGVLLYAMLSGDKTFSRYSSTDMEGDTLCFSADKLAHVSSRSLGLLGSLLNGEPALRPSAKEALEVLDSSLRKLCHHDK